MKADEFLLDASARQLLLVAPYGANYAALIAKLANDKAVQVVECASVAEASGLARKLGAAMILCHANGPGDVVNVINMVRPLVDGIKKKTIRIVMTMKFKHDELEVKLRKMGVAEIIREPLADKTFQFKLDRHIKSMPVAKVAAAPGAKAEAGKAKGVTQAEDKGKLGAAKNANKVVMVDPLTLASDCFILTKDEPKKFAGRWIFKLVAPPPNCGKWIKATIEGVPLAWQWKPSVIAGSTPGAPDPFVKDQGHWVFKGNKPEFQTDNIWMFVAAKPGLVFMHESKEIAHRVKLDDAGTLNVARDSSAAKGALVKIRELLQLFLKNKGEEKKGGYGRVDDDDDGDGASADSGTKIEMIDPLKITSDCFLLQDRESRRVAGKWLTRLTGPGPTTGRWDPVKVEGTLDEYWQWIPGDKVNPFIKDAGAWVFRGNLPRFQDDGWNFSGERPELSFRQDGKAIAIKLKCDDAKLLQIAKDSPRALELLPAILASIDKAVQSGGEKAKKEEEAKVGDKKSADAKTAKSSKDEEKGDDHHSSKKHNGGTGADDAEDFDEESEDALWANTASKRREKKKKQADAGADDLDEIEPFGGESEDDDQADAAAASGDDGVKEKKPKRKSPFAKEGDQEDNKEDSERGYGSKKSASDDESEEEDGLRMKKPPDAGERAPFGAYKKKHADTDGADEDEPSDDEESVGQTASGKKTREAREPEVVEKKKRATQKNEEADDGDEGDGSDEIASESKKRKARADAEQSDAGDPFDQGEDSDESEEQGDGEVIPLRKKRAKSEAEDADGARDLKKNGKAWDETRAAVKNHKSGPEKKMPWNKKNPKASDISKPLMSPIALGFLLSEIIVKRDRDFAAVGVKYCSYLSASLGELRAELWVQKNGQWRFFASMDGKEGELESGVKNLSGPGSDANRLKPKFATPEIVVAPVVGGSAGVHEAVIGAIVLGGHADDIAKAPLTYLEAAAEMVRGLLKAA